MLAGESENAWEAPFDANPTAGGFLKLAEAEEKEEAGTRKQRDEIG